MSQLFHTNPLDSEINDLMKPAARDAESFWREKLSSLSPSGPLANNRPSKSGPATGSQTCTESIPVGAKLRERLTSVDHSLPWEFDTLVAGAWAYLLSCHNQGEKVTFGLRFSGLPQKPHHVWPVSAAPVANESAALFLDGLQGKLRELKAREPVSLLDLHHWCEVPLDQTVLESVLDLRSTEAPPDSAHPLIVRFSPHGGPLELIFRTRDFSTDSAQRLGLQLLCLLESLVTDPQRALGEQEMLPLAEKQVVLFDWNNSRKPYPFSRGLHELVESQVEKTPEAPAVIFPSAGSASEPQSLTYRQLNARANQLAHHLIKLKVGPEAVVGICLERSIDLIVAVLAVIKTGAAYVPFDPTYPKERLAFMLEDTRAPVLLTQNSLASQLPSSQARILRLDADRTAIDSEDTRNPDPVVTSENLAYLIYTSGSTGKPKGVAMRQGPLINLLHWQLENWSSDGPGRTLQFASLNFDVSFQEIFATLAWGGALVLVPEDTRRDSATLIEFLEKHRVQRLFLPFIALKHLAEAADMRNIFPADLREIITAGEQLQITPAVARFFRRLPACTLENQYGPSETHVVTAGRLEGDPSHWPALPHIGRPIANTQIYLLNDQRRPVPIGVPGELYLGGVCLARGYLNRPELTAEKFVPHLFSRDPASRLYKTGDLARYLPDGNIEFLGRLDHQVKIRGFRIELGEIEAALSQHAGLRGSAVVARDNVAGDKQLAAYVVPREGEIPSSELRKFLKDRLPDYFIPAVFVTVDRLPLTPNGKVDRRALPDPPAVTATGDESVKLPRTPLELQLKLVFERFLQQRPIGIDVSFFELGGDSLQALKLIVEIEGATGRKLPLGILYQASTVEALALKIEENAVDAWSALVPLHPHGTRPPLFLVHTTPGDVLGYGNLIYHLAPDQPCHGFQSCGLQRPELSHTRVEQMAAHYVELMRARQARGPYFLGGWCYGGIIALEMAQQLRAAGEKTALLALIETPAHAPSRSNWQYYARRLRCLFGMKPREWKRYLLEKIKYYRGAKTADEMRFKRVDKSESLDPRVVEEQNQFLEKLEHVYHANLDALDDYTSQFYPEKIILFNAAEPDPALIRDPYYGWLGLAAEIEIHVIPGNHDTILMEPNVRVLAEKLGQSLASAQEKQPRAAATSL